MKCIKKDGKIRRVKDAKAFGMVHGAGWAWCPKNEWKKEVRDKA